MSVYMYMCVRVQFVDGGNERKGEGETFREN